MRGGAGAKCLETCGRSGCRTPGPPHSIAACSRVWGGSKPGSIEAFAASELCTAGGDFGVVSGEGTARNRKLYRKPWRRERAANGPTWTCCQSCRGPSIHLDLTVFHADLAVGGLGDFVAVGDDHEGELARVSQVVEEPDDLVLALAVEVAGRLVSQE